MLDPFVSFLVTRRLASGRRSVNNRSLLAVLRRGSVGTRFRLRVILGVVREGWR